MTAKVLTANRLTDGIAVWLDAAGTWSENLQDARLAGDPEAVAELDAIGKRDFAANIVVDLALIDVKEVDGLIWPLRVRERIRAAGPTIPYAAGYKAADPDFIAP